MQPDPQTGSSRYEGPAFDFTGSALRDNWASLHRGNLEKFPESNEAQEAWRAYHEGRFRDSIVAGEAAGDDCLLPAAFSATACSQYLETDDERKPGLFDRAVDLATQAAQYDAGNANAFYILAVAQGRQAQFVSMTDALSQGIGLKIRDAAMRCLELQPEHCEAHTTLAAWHAEMVYRLGSMLARLSFAANNELAEQHFDRAIALCPDLPLPYIEKAHGVMLMYGETKAELARRLLQHAAEIRPLDAVQAMEIEKELFDQTLIDTFLR